MTPLKSQKQVRAFIGLVRCYRGIWVRRSHLLHPLTFLTSNMVKFRWTYMEHKSFDDIKYAVAHNTLLSYPYFNKKIGIHMDASDCQLVAVIIQGVKKIIPQT